MKILYQHGFSRVQRVWKKPDLVVYGRKVVKMNMKVDYMTICLKFRPFIYKNKAYRVPERKLWRIKGLNH